VSDCDKFRELYEAYALGALDAEDRSALEAHLATECKTCAAEIDKARWLVSQLAYLAPQSDPPASLRRAILQTVRAEAATTQPEREARRAAWLPAWAWAAAAAMVLLTLFSIYQTRKMQQQLTELEARNAAQQQLRAQLEADREAYQHALAIVSAADMRPVNLKATGKPELPEIHAYWSAQLGLVMMAAKVPAPVANRTLQLWVVPKSGKPISAGVFLPDANGGVMMITSPQAEIAGAAALAITDEPTGGSAQPTTTPIWVGPIT
jgi:anti-sigma-K factor RskA